MRMLRMFVFPLSAMVAVYRVVRGASVGRFVVQRFLQLSADDLWLPMQFLYSGFRKALGFARHRRRKVPMMKSLRMSRIMRCCVALFAAVASMCCFAAPAMANNHGDTAWSAYLKNWETSDTPNRQKQDSSYAYIKADFVTKNRTIRAWALGYSNNDVKSSTVNFTTGQSRKISQHAFENNGYKPCQIHLRLQNTAKYSDATQAWGVWNPDSV